MGQGLSKMQRTHIHFAVGYPGDKNVMSGMRYSSDIMIEIDVPKAMKAKIKFHRSKNNVILSSGFDGIIPTMYFNKVTIKHPLTSE